MLSNTVSTHQPKWQIKIFYIDMLSSFSFTVILVTSSTIFLTLIDVAFTEFQLCSNWEIYRFGNILN